MSRRLALLIGNVHYQDGRLHTPVSGKTFTALADALESPIAGFDEVFVSINKPAVELQLAIAEFLEMSQTPDDVLLLYFAGHALYHQARPYLACADTYTASYLDATTIQADYVRRRFSLHPSRQKLLLLDCSTSPLLSGDVLPADEGWLGQAFQSVGTQVVAVARPYIPDAPPLSTLTPALTEAIQTGQVRLDAVGLAAAAAWLSQIATPPAVEMPAVAAESPVTEAETPAAEDVADVAAEAEVAIPVVVAEVLAANAEAAADAETADTEAATVVETAVVEAASAGVIETTTITGDSSPVEVESEAVEPAVMVRVGEAATTAVPPAPARRFPRWAAAVLLILLLLLVGGLYGRELFAPTAVSPAHTPTTAAVAVLPTDAPTASPTSTATLPAVTATPTATTAAAGQNSDATGTAVSAAASPSPTSSPTPVVTSSPTPVGVHIVRQLVYMRSGPAINFRIVEYLTQGTAVTVLGRTESGEWYNVQLEDGRSGWVFSEMVAATDGEALGIPLVGTIPAPTDEFYNFVAQRTEDGLTITVGHVYAGTAGPEGMFLARLLPETDLIQPTYENGQALGLGDFVVHFARVAEGEYTSTAVQLCMASTAGVEFFCETFPLRRQW